MAPGETLPKHLLITVTPAQAGVHLIAHVVEKVDSGLRRNDGEMSKIR